MDEIITTIEDMENLYYSQKGRAFLNSNDLINPFVTKADAPVTSSTTGVYNAVYGVQAWSQLNQEANTFGVIPKVPWTRSGWRIISARADTRPYGGRGEGATLPETVKPTFAELSTKPSTSAVTFENTEVQEFLATGSGDDAFAAMADLRTIMGVEHKDDLNFQLNTQNGTAAGNNFESIDRVCGSYAELSNCNDSTGAGYSSGDLDMYASESFNRDGGATQAFDAHVEHNSSTVRALTDSILQAVIQNTAANGANQDGQFWQTGYDTWATINQLYDPQVRYNLIGTSTVQPSVNGIKTLEGREVGTLISTLHGRPLITSKDTVQDTGGITRIYLLDTSNPEGYDIPRLSIKIAKPTQYFEAGMNQGNPFEVNKLTTKAMFRTMGELICTFFKVQGKARDLKS